METSIKPKRFCEKIGMVFRIDLKENGQYAYGQVATKGKKIFFDHADEKDQWTPIEDIIQKPIAFYASVDWYVLKEGLWNILGVWPVKPEHQVFPDPFGYHPILETYVIFKIGVGRVNCRLEETYGRETFASWTDGGIEQRLRDHFAERPNYDALYDRSRHIKSPFPKRKEFYKKYGYDFHWLDDDPAHPTKHQDFDKAVVIEYSKDLEALRGAQQLLIDYYGGAQSSGGTSSNPVNVISKNNPKRDLYLEKGKELLEGKPSGDIG